MSLNYFYSPCAKKNKGYSETFQPHQAMSKNMELHSISFRLLEGKKQYVTYECLGQQEKFTHLLCPQELAKS